jgi:hypothetical protein
MVINRLDNVDEREKQPVTHKLFKLIQKETQNLNWPLTNKEIELTIKKPLDKKVQAQMIPQWIITRPRWLYSWIIRIVKQINVKFLPTVIRKKKTFLNSVYETTFLDAKTE